MTNHSYRTEMAYYELQRAREVEAAEARADFDREERLLASASYHPDTGKFISAEVAGDCDHKRDRYCPICKLLDSGHGYLLAK